MILKETKPSTDVDVLDHFQPDSFRSRADTKRKHSREDAICQQTTERSEDLPVCDAVQKAHEELTDHWLNMVVQKEQELRTLRTNLLNLHLEGCRVDRMGEDWRYRSQILENKAAMLEKKLKHLKMTTDFRWVTDYDEFTDITCSEEKFLQKLKLLEIDFKYLEEFTAKSGVVFGRNKYQNMFGQNWQYPKLYRDGVLDVIREYCHVFGNDEDLPVKMPDYPTPDYVMPRKRLSGFETYRVQFDESLYDFIRCGTVQVLPRVSEDDEIARILEAGTDSKHQTESRLPTPTIKDTKKQLTTITDHGAGVDESPDEKSLKLLHIPKPPEKPKSKKGRNLHLIPTTASKLEKLPQTLSNQSARTVTTVKSNFTVDRMSISSPCWPIGNHNVSKFTATDPRCGRLRFKFRYSVRKSKLPINVAYLMRDRLNYSFRQWKSTANRVRRIAVEHTRISTNLKQEDRIKACNLLMGHQQIAKQKDQILLNFDPRRRRYYPDRTASNISNIPVRVEYLSLEQPMDDSSTGKSTNPKLDIEASTASHTPSQKQQVKLPVIKNVRNGVRDISLNTNSDAHKATHSRRMYAKTVIDKRRNWALPDRFRSKVLPSC